MAESLAAESAEGVTGLVLAGGRGRRMGGVDKGLLLHAGTPLAQRALQRLAPQVQCLAVNANRHPDRYAAFGVPVWPDTVPGQPGPLAGLLAGLSHATTPWLAAVPCDLPHVPSDLVGQLRAALDGRTARAAFAVAGGRAHPACCLLHADLARPLRAALDAGERRVLAWLQAQGARPVDFDDAAAFVNLNTPRDLIVDAGAASGC